MKTKNKNNTLMDGDCASTSCSASQLNRYQVHIENTKIVVIEAEDEEEALRLAKASEKREEGSGEETKVYRF